MNQKPRWVAQNEHLKRWYVPKVEGDTAELFVDHESDESLRDRPEYPYQVLLKGAGKHGTADVIGHGKTLDDARSVISRWRASRG